MRYHLGFLFALALCSAAYGGNGGDPDKYRNVPDNVRQWFKDVRSPQGVPCCDVADGYRVDWRRVMGDSGFEVYVEDSWRKVPKEAIVGKDYASTNPTGDGVVWFVHTKVDPFIRCFVPGPDQ